jgi:hypothetical protein
MVLNTLILTTSQGAKFGYVVVSYTVHGAGIPEIYVELQASS